MRLKKAFALLLIISFLSPALSRGESKTTEEQIQKNEYEVEKEEVEKEKEEIIKISSRPALPKSKIEKDYNLFQFGYQIFSGPPAFFPVTEAPVGPDYTLGPGDEIIIDVWGMVEGHYQARIDRDGGIVLPKIGRIQLWGQTFENCQKLIEKQFLKHYSDFQISITIGRLRTIEVFVVGEAVQPGTYQLSSLSTIFTALYTAGGPTKVGSLRDVRLIRNNKTVASFDLYSFFLLGDKSKDLYLQSEDIVFISPIGPLVGISGDVKRPAIYELKEKDIPLEDLIQLAGGLFSSGQDFQVHLEKSEVGERKIVKAKLSESLMSERLKNGDFAQVFAKETPLYKKVQYITIEGEIKYPGRYAFKEGDRLSSVLKRAGGYTEDAYLPASIFIREAIEQKQKEVLAQFLNNQRAALLAKSSQANVKLEIEQAEKLVSLVSQTMPVGRIAVTLLPLADFEGSPSDVVLCDGDQLTISQKPSTVSVIGSVNSPGTICYEPGLNQNYYIKKCGGLTKWADKDGIFIIKPNGMAIMQKSMSTRFIDPGDTIVVPQTFREPLWAVFKDTVQVLYQIGASAAVLSTID